METQKCRQCKRLLPIQNFFFNDKEHKTCLACSESRRKYIIKCELCQTGASFNFEGEAKAVRCSKHKEIGMVNVISPKCIVCKTTQPNYGYEEDKATHCKKCSLPTMIDLKHQKCIVCKITQPVYGYEEDNKATHCKKCSLQGMIDLKNPKCIVCKTTRPAYGYEEDNKATHCKKCSLPTMIDLKHPKCIVCKTTIPNYGYEEDNKATHCKKCSLQGMINLKSPKCIVCKITQPVYGYEEDNKATHCKKCSLQGMIDLKSLKCLVCKKTQPNYGYQEDGKATHCKKCSSPTMIDLKNPKCEKCDTRASYGLPLNKPFRCTTHKEDGMIQNPRKKCSKRGCTNYSMYGLTTPIHCEEHKNSNDIILVERTCKKCGKIDVVNHEGICMNFCLLETKGMEIYQKRQKLKEERIVNLLTKQFGKPDFQNKVIDSKCGKERPDIVYDCKTHVLVIEVDEKQHKGYECKRNTQGEVERMMLIYDALGFEKVFFIRYNPDSYKVDGKVVNTSNTVREDILIKWISKLMRTHEGLPNLGVMYLYYDEYVSTDQDYYEIKNMYGKKPKLVNKKFLNK